MELEVKSVKVASTGTSKKGEWELIVVTTEDNSEYRTFDKKAKHLTSGAVIEIEPVIKEGKISFKEFKIISEGQVSPPGGGKQMTPETWAEKDRLERWSIETQTAFKGIVELVSSIYAKPDGEIPDYLFDVYTAALDWALAHFETTSVKRIITQAEKDAEELWPGASNKGKTLPPETEGTIYEQEETSGKKMAIRDQLTEPTTLQELLTWYSSHGKEYTPSRACIALGVKAPTEITDIAKAFRDLSDKGEF